MIILESLPVRVREGPKELANVETIIARTEKAMAVWMRKV